MNNTMEFISSRQLRTFLKKQFQNITLHFSVKKHKELGVYNILIKEAIGSFISKSGHGFIFSPETKNKMSKKNKQFINYLRKMKFKIKELK